MTTTSGADIWDAFTARLGEARGTLLAEGAPAGAFDQAEGARYLSRLIRLGLEIYLEGGDPDFPSFVALSRETNEIPPASFTPPWQAVQCFVRIGRISRLKSTRSAPWAASGALARIWPGNCCALTSTTPICACGCSGQTAMPG